MRSASLLWLVGGVSFDQPRACRVPWRGISHPTGWSFSIGFTAKHSSQLFWLFNGAKLHRCKHIAAFASLPYSCSLSNAFLRNRLSFPLFNLHKNNLWKRISKFHFFLLSTVQSHPGGSTARTWGCRNPQFASFANFQFFSTFSFQSFIFPVPQFWNFLYWLTLLTGQICRKILELLILCEKKVFFSPINFCCIFLGHLANTAALRVE